MSSANEESRIQALHQLRILDTGTSENFDRITRMASRLFDLPISAISLTDRDRQWFKSRVGVPFNTISRLKAPCSEVAETGGPLIINDFALDPNYADSALAGMGVRFYAGAPLVTSDGLCLGSMCVLGDKPREAAPAEIDALIDLAAMAMSEIELRHAFGRTDPVTGLPNRLQFGEDLQDLAREPDDEKQRLLVVIDLMTAERFSGVIRTRGAAYAENLISRTAATLAPIVDPFGRLYRVGPCEFAYLARDDGGGAQHAARLERRLDELDANDTWDWSVTVAIGVAPFVLGHALAEEILRLGQSAVEEARASGARVVLYGSELDRAQRRRLRLIDDFGHALQGADELNLVYQPRLDLASGRCLGVEALLRWRHPELGAVSPGEFMPLVEMTDLVGATTAWVLDAALTQASAWKTAGVELVVSINVTAANLQEPGFATGVLDRIARHGLLPCDVELELTERAVFGDSPRALMQLHSLAQAGVTLAIDDFGTGYSSLSYLQTLPCHVVKIDQSFIREMAQDARRRTLVGSIISLSHHLGYRVVAEGVETPDIADLLRSAGCDEVQGYLFGRPMEVSALETWIAAQDRKSALASAA